MTYFIIPRDYLKSRYQDNLSFISTLICWCTMNIVNFSMTFMRFVMAFMIGIILTSCGQTDNHDYLGTSELSGAIRDDKTGFYLTENPNEQGIHWVMYCFDVASDEPSEWQDCLEYSPFDPSELKDDRDDLIVFLNGQIPELEGQISITQMAQQIQEQTAILHGAQQNIEQGIAVGRDTLVISAGHALIGHALNTTSPQQLNNKQHWLQKAKVFSSRGIDPLRFLKNNRLRYILHGISHSKIVKMAIVVVGAVSLVLLAKGFVDLGVVRNYQPLDGEQITTHELLSVFLNHSDKTVRINDALKTVDIVLTSLEEQIFINNLLEEGFNSSE
ncbi:MAG: hypothetical protein OXC40_04795 [Proteobacteria bacterium]|nr:hypothetical protein [Pseudomonadota bacterium]